MTDSSPEEEENKANTGGVVIPMGFKNFYSAREAITGIENIRMIQKGQILGQSACQSSFNNFANLMA